MLFKQHAWFSDYKSCNGAPTGNGGGNKTLLKSPRCASPGRLGSPGHYRTPEPVFGTRARAPPSQAGSLRAKVKVGLHLCKHGNGGGVCRVGVRTGPRGGSSPLGPEERKARPPLPCPAGHSPAAGWLNSGLCSPTACWAWSPLGAVASVPSALRVSMCTDSCRDETGGLQPPGIEGTRPVTDIGLCVFNAPEHRPFRGRERFLGTS